MALTIENFERNEMRAENLYSSRTRHEAIEHIEDVWSKGFPTIKKSNYSPFSEDVIQSSTKSGKSPFVSKAFTTHKKLDLKRNLLTGQKFFFPVGDSFLSSEFREIIDEIHNSKEILNYMEGWDGYDALPISVELYNAAISFLIKYVKFIQENTGIIIEAPEINAGINGNVFLSWRTENARLAISFEFNLNREIIAHYYGDLNEKQPIKGNVPINEVVEYLAYWMKNLV